MSLKKITVEVPEELLAQARMEGEGITDTIRRALELAARNRAYKRLEEVRGSVKFSINYDEMRDKS